MNDEFSSSRDLSLNRLTEVPHALYKLTRVEFLTMSSNPLRDLNGAFDEETNELKRVSEL